jgi:hypothetical protein
MARRASMIGVAARGVVAIASSFGIIAILPLTSGEGAVAGDNPAGLYAGASVGQSSFETDFISYAGGPSSFRGQPLGWKVFVGARPLSFLGAELEYANFGQSHFGPSGEITSSSGEARGVAAFAVGYLPIPIPRLDVFAKVGAARFRSEYHYSGDFPDTCVYDPTLNECVTVGQATVSGASNATGLAYGIGAQYHFGRFAVRGEYERISTSESATAPSLLSVGLTYSFF